jgi:hypothetical protein
VNIGLLFAYRIGRSILGNWEIQGLRSLFMPLYPTSALFFESIALGQATGKVRLGSFDPAAFHGRIKIVLAECGFMLEIERFHRCGAAEFTCVKGLYDPRCLVGGNGLLDCMMILSILRNEPYMYYGKETKINGISFRRSKPTYQNLV